MSGRDYQQRDKNQTGFALGKFRSTVGGDGRVDSSTDEMLSDYNEALQSHQDQAKNIEFARSLSELSILRLNSNKEPDILGTHSVRVKLTTAMGANAQDLEFEVPMKLSEDGERYELHLTYAKGNQRYAVLGIITDILDGEKTYGSLYVVKYEEGASPTFAKINTRSYFGTIAVRTRVESRLREEAETAEAIYRVESSLAWVNNMYVVLGRSFYEYDLLSFGEEDEPVELLAAFQGESFDTSDFDTMKTSKVKTRYTGVVPAETSVTDRFVNIKSWGERTNGGRTFAVDIQRKSGELEEAMFSITEIEPLSEEEQELVTRPELITNTWEQRTEAQPVQSSEPAKSQQATENTPSPSANSPWGMRPTQPATPTQPQPAPSSGQSQAPTEVVTDAPATQQAVAPRQQAIVKQANPSASASASATSTQAPATTQTQSNPSRFEQGVERLAKRAGKGFRKEVRATEDRLNNLVWSLRRRLESGETRTQIAAPQQQPATAPKAQEETRIGLDKARLAQQASSSRRSNPNARPTTIRYSWNESSFLNGPLDRNSRAYKGLLDLENNLTNTTYAPYTLKILDKFDNRGELKNFWTISYPIRDLISQVTAAYDATPTLIYRVIVESEFFRNGSFPIQSPSGSTALGPAQIIDGTARRLGMRSNERRFGVPSLCGAAKYMAILQDYYKQDASLAYLAYHLGEGNPGSSSTSIESNGIMGVINQARNAMPQNERVEWFELNLMDLYIDNKIPNRKNQKELGAVEKSLASHFLLQSPDTTFSRNVIVDGRAKVKSFKFNKPNDQYSIETFAKKSKGKMFPSAAMKDSVCERATAQWRAVFQ